eukprot:CAMPEP_0178991818 /NCGR_PEP_ID=MMETSP0795-20121207/5751_1 /TAXON_ID=88552 /ORGANISM="Amoebophrya sp., Strain Ameob2" /LENGTH=398 /DNA_ID=CAMNT_0020683593 /DNA_START=343 /DNA_END=1539 /DNA_ORIENTATION=-
MSYSRPRTATGGSYGSSNFYPSTSSPLHAMNPESLDAVGKLEMAFVHFDLWQEAQFLHVIEQIEKLSCVFVGLSGELVSGGSGLAEQVISGGGAGVDGGAAWSSSPTTTSTSGLGSSLSVMRAPHTLEACRRMRNEEFTEIAAVATTELKQLSEQVVDQEQRSTTNLDDIEKKAKTMLKTIQTNLAVEERERSGRLEAASDRMGSQFKEIRSNLDAAIHTRRTSHERLVGLIENLESSLAGHLESERQVRQAASERMLSLFENLLGCVEIKAEQKSLFSSLAGGPEQLGNDLQPTCQEHPRPPQAISSPRTARLLAQYGSGQGRTGPADAPSAASSSTSSRQDRQVLLEVDEDAADGRSAAAARIPEPGEGQPQRGAMDPSLAEMYTSIKKRLQQTAD